MRMSVCFNGWLLNSKMMAKQQKRKYWRTQHPTNQQPSAKVCVCLECFWYKSKWEKISFSFYVTLSLNRTPKKKLQQIRNAFFLYSVKEFNTAPLQRGSIKNNKRYKKKTRPTSKLISTRALNINYSHSSSTLSLFFNYFLYFV